MCEKLPSPLVYIHYMRFARRCEGVAEARQIFKRARKDPQVAVFAFAQLVVSSLASSYDDEQGGGSRVPGSSIRIRAASSAKPYTLPLP